MSLIVRLTACVGIAQPLFNIVYFLHVHPIWFPHKENDIPMYGNMIIHFENRTDSELVIYSFKNCTGENWYRKVKEKVIVLTCDILHNVLRWGIVQCVTISSSSQPVIHHLFFFGCPHSPLGIYSQQGRKFFPCVVYIETLSVQHGLVGYIFPNVYVGGYGVGYTCSTP